MVKPKQSKALSLPEDEAMARDGGVLRGDGELCNMEASLNKHSSQFKKILQAILHTKNTLDPKIDVVSAEDRLLLKDHWKMAERLDDTELGSFHGTGTIVIDTRQLTDINTLQCRVEDAYGVIVMEQHMFPGPPRVL
ncbi:hypothetical protein NDU88_002606 [Pleurodeles waltl]|uniref:Uncharacterized protein n=1 Tax=Pleurodeles waltl TaxID=8319 RepID=A0AAV7L1Q5_PLEWA|nr:hypothetical protein NDU88_002606 [Pleurodeles waltl]